MILGSSGGGTVQAEVTANKGTGALPARELHGRFLDAISPALLRQVSTDLDRKPLHVEVSPPLPSPLRAYLFTLTYNVAERKQGTYRSQVILPGHSSRDPKPAHLDTSDAAFVVVGGYEPDLEVFCFWDARLHDRYGYTYSRGLQVDDRTIYDAANHGVAEQVRRLRQGEGRTETIVSVRSDELVSGLRQRWALSCARMLEED